MYRIFAVVLAALVLGLLAQQSAQAQPVRVKAEGTVVAVTPGMIQMRDPKLGVVQVKIPEDRRVVAVTGRLRPDQLQTGMIFRVVGRLEGNEFAEPVKRVTIYRPLEGYPPGVLADDDDAVVVTGPLAAYRDGKITISAGRRRITGTLDPKAVLAVETGDYGIAVAGDPIVASGYRSGQGPISAREVKITVNSKGAPPEDKPDTKKKKAN